MANQKLIDGNSGKTAAIKGKSTLEGAEKQNEPGEPRSKSVAAPNGHSTSRKPIHCCFQNQTLLKKGAPMRRFKAQDITTSKPRSKQNFMCQQTQATYNLYKLSSKTRLDHNAPATIGGSLSRKKTTTGQLTSKKPAGGEPQKKVDSK